MTLHGSAGAGPDALTVRPLREGDLDAADRIMRLAFGTFVGMPEPARFGGDAGYVRSRWRAGPGSAFAAEAEGRLAGSNFATRWGSFGFFGPLSLDPALWGRGHANALMEPVIETLDRWGVTQAGLFTFAQSPKHIGLYQKFGFRPRALTLVLDRPVRSGAPAPEGWLAYSRLREAERAEALSAMRRLTDAIHPGLDASCEVESIAAQSLGETVLVEDAGLRAFAACHVGPGSEAGSGTCYVKFGAAAPGPRAPEHFRRLVDACEALAREVGATHVVAGVSAARREAYEELLGAGFRVRLTGIAMHRPNEAGFSRPGVYVIDDWR